MPLPLLSLLLFLLPSASWAVHCTLSGPHARELAHRWRPLASTAIVNGELVPASTNALRRYTRALHALEDPAAFGLLACDDEDDALHLFVARGTAVEAILWAPDASFAERTVALRDLRAWHRRTFADRDGLRLGAGVEFGDRRHGGGAA